VLGIPEKFAKEQRDLLRNLFEKTEDLIPELIERGRAPTGNYLQMTSLGYVEIDRGEDDLRPLISQLISPLLDVVTEQEYRAGFMTYGEPITIGLLLERLDWCVTSDPLAAKIFPEWDEQDDLQRFEAVSHFVTQKLQDYRLRLLEIADTEEPVPDDLGLPPRDGQIDDLRLFGGILTVNDKSRMSPAFTLVISITGLFSVMCCQGSKLSESQQSHLVEALHRTDSLCPVSMAQWIP
jgi:hypothetical protein